MGPGILGSALAAAAFAAGGDDLEALLGQEAKGDAVRELVRAQDLRLDRESGWYSPRPGESGPCLSDELTGRVTLVRVERGCCCQYSGPLPHGLSWGMSKAEVFATFGPGVKGNQSSEWSERWAWDLGGAGYLLLDFAPKLETLVLVKDLTGHGFAEAPPRLGAVADAPAPVADAPVGTPVAATRPALPSVDGRLASGARAPGDAAVVVGIADYLRLPDVPYADRDADAFRSWLVYTRGVPLERVRLITSPASRDHIRRAVEEAGREVAPGGSVWVYFAGHGAADPATGRRMLLGDDAAADLTSFSTRGVTVEELEGLAGAGGGQPVLVLDACFTGVGRGGTELLAGKRFAVPAYVGASDVRAVQWNAASPGQASGPLEEVQHGAFTYWTVGALRGWADGELTGVRDGRVTGEEAQAYVTRALRAVGVRDQEPVWLGPADTVLSEGATEVGPGLE